MKHLIFLAALLCATATAAQTVTRDASGNFHAVRDTVKVPTGNTYTDSRGKVWPVYVTAKGIYYIERVSAKTGKTYRQYLKP